MNFIAAPASFDQWLTVTAWRRRADAASYLVRPNP